jgi:hypothetical protein
LRRFGSFSRSRTRSRSTIRSTIFSATWRRARGGGLATSASTRRPRPRLVVGDERGVERLRQLGAVAVERVGLQRQLPGQHVGVLAVLDRGVVGHVDGLGDGARDEGLRRRHHADVALDREEALADLAAGIGAVEDRQVLGFRCGAPSSVIAPQTWMLAGLDLLLREAEEGQQVEGEIVELLVGEAERS